MRNSLFVGMAALRANSVFDWTSHFLQAFANEAEGIGVRTASSSRPSERIRQNIGGPNARSRRPLNFYPCGRLTSQPAFNR